MTDRPGQPGKHIRPLHPPFTHFPIAAYVLAAGFDLVSAVGGGRHQWAGQLWHAGTFVLIGGLAICLITMVTGFADIVRFGEHSPAALRTMAAHVCIMAGVFMIGVVDIALRLTESHRSSTPLTILVLTMVAAVAACTGGLFGGELVYRHGTGVAVGTAAGAGATAGAIAADQRPEADGHSRTVSPDGIRQPGLD
jgi:uncharacterized membrane protein